MKKDRNFWKIIALISFAFNFILMIDSPAYKSLKRSLKHYINHDLSNVSLIKTILPSSVKQTEVLASEPVLAFYQLMKDVHEILEKQKIDYWADGGTLLGMIRHKGLIPWDDDLDISIPLEDEVKFQDEAIPLLEKLGYVVESSGFGYTITLSPASYQQASSERSLPKCDVFVVTFKADQGIYHRKGARVKWPNNVTKDELYPLKKYQFGKIEIFGPHQPEPYLDRLYGKNWRTIAYKEAGHLLKSGKREPFVLTPVDLQPAQPLGPLLDRVK